MNLLYILLLVLWSAFNSSDAWYYREPPHTTAQTSQTGAPSNPCWYWYNTPCYWATTQPNDADQTHYQTQTQAPSRWRPYYQMPTQAPSRRRPYYQKPTQAPSWWRPYYQKPTQAPSWRRPYYWMTTQAPSRRRPYYQKPTQAPSWRRTYYWMTTQAPSRRRPYYWMTTQAPSWRRPYYWMTTQTPFRRRPYYQKPTQAPSWRRPYYQMPTQAPSWRRPYYWMTTSYWRIQDAPVPSITVFRQNQDREHVIVMCSFGRRFTESSFQLSVEGEHSYTLKNPLCYSNEKCVFDVKVSTPVSFTCVHEINSAVNCQSETYAYSPSGKTYDFPAVLDQHENGVSSFYFGFFSFIVVCLFTMTAAVIMATLKTISNAKGSKITGAANDYTDV